MNIFMRLRFPFGQIKTFKLPDLGEKIKEATVKKWYVQVGDKINEVNSHQFQFDTVADVATDKMFTQIPSSHTGKIHKIFHKEEDLCQVGEDFLEIEIESNVKDVQEKPQQESKQVIKQEQHIQQTNNDSKIQAIPKVRQLAKQQGVDLSKISGTGPNGRILETDLTQTKKIQQNESQNLNQLNLKTDQIQEQKIIKMSDFQKGMQKSMTEANTIPHLYLKEEIDITSLAEVREKIKKDKNITFMTLLIKTFSMALLKYPIINSTYDVSKPFEYTQHSSHNISIALDSPKGLVVPNIKNVQDLSIVEIQDELQSLREKGEKGQLGPKELYGGTICLSNIGTIGGTYTGPLILAPQVCIVGIGRLQTVPRYDEKLNVVPRKIMNFSFGCDHRVLDGATVAKFCNQWKQYLENPQQMFLQLK